MDTNGRLAGRNGHGVEQHVIGAVAVGGVSLRVPREARGNIVLYGSVLSSDGNTWYTVKKERLGRYQFAYHCTCAGNFLGEHPICRHLAAFKLAEVNRL